MKDFTLDANAASEDYIFDIRNLISNLYGMIKKVHLNFKTEPQP